MEKSVVDDQNVYFKLALDYVTDTNCSIYLTGKAGTGKTTFLKYLKQFCTKNMIVVAPTGVAAINAGGVTMHSFFQLPFAPYLPQAKRGFGNNQHVVDRNMLLQNIKLSTNKRKLIEELELLIIDEASMLRCDMLDAIDTILSTFRRNTKPFGGVQLLFIGDLYQLPPVITDQEKEIFYTYYESPFFFHAKVFERIQLTFIELKKIYRQNEQKFIDLLNSIRHNHLEEEDFELLNSRYKPNFSPAEDENYITLTSHNAKADNINKLQLEKLAAPLYFFNCEISGDFNEKQFPTDMQLKLKEGAQVMFVKNDSTGLGRYYNGKIARIEKINHSEIIVRFPDNEETMILEKETWENITYSFNEQENTVEEKVLGSFTQYPVRLAWAITIHKSQGLTFQRAIIDAGASFAPGQVYVALSRCVSLDGIVLHSQILQRSIQSDMRIYDFNNLQKPLTVLQNELENEATAYTYEKIFALFRWNRMLDAAHILYEKTLAAKAIPENINTIEFARKIVDEVKQQSVIAEKFCMELDLLFNDTISQKDDSKLKVRLQRAITYFVNRIYDELIKPVRVIMLHLSDKTRVKKYFTVLQESEDSWWQKIDHLQNCTIYGERILQQEIIKRTVAEKISLKKKEKGDSAKETLAYYKGGKTVEEISKFRNLATSTIEGHLVDYIKNGEVSVFDFVKQEQVDQVKKIYDKQKEFSSSEIVYAMDNQISHTQVRMIVNHLLWKKEITVKPK